MSGLRRNTSGLGVVRTCVTLIAVSLSALSLFGCSQFGPDTSSSNQQHTQPTPATTVSTGATGATKTNEFSSVRSGIWGFTVAADPAPDEVIPENGAAFRVQVSVGKLTQLRDANDASPYAQWAKNCADIEESSVALIPLRLRAQNISNHDLPITVNLAPNLSTPQYALRPTLANADGCWDFVKGRGLQTTADFDGNLAAGKAATEDMVFVARQYYDDGFPNGRPTELREIQVQLGAEVAGQAGSALTLEQTCFSGRPDFDYFDLNTSSVPNHDPVLPRMWLFKPPADDRPQAGTIDLPRCR